MSQTLEGMSPELTAEIRELLDSKHPLAAEQKLLDYAVTEDHAERLGQLDRNVAFPAEKRMRDRLSILISIPLLIALLFLFRWLGSKH